PTARGAFCPQQSPEIAANRTSSFLTDLFNLTSSSIDYDYNYTANDTDYATDDASYAAARPCHNHYCPFFHRVAPPLLTATGATAVVATTALLLALALRPHAWPHGRASVAQLALCCVLFAVTLFPMAAGIAWGWRAGEGPCRAVLLLWQGSVLAQGLLLGCGQRGHARCVPVVLWVTGMAMAVPAALSGGTVGTGQSAQCVQRSVDAVSVVYVLQLAACCCVLLLLLPGAMLRGTWGAVGRGPGWLFWALWAPYGAALVGGFLLEAGGLPPSCGAFEGFDFALGLSAALGGLHCCLVPLALLLAAFR
ncbi:ACKR1 protein, partial [Odontophorus gujanensis]|nr:ACKR1 protein [Odontophorus gujanensis]